MCFEIIEAWLNCKPNMLANIAAGGSFRAETFDVKLFTIYKHVFKSNFMHSIQNTRKAGNDENKT